MVVGEGKSKKVLSNEDEAFDESTIPKKKFAGMSFSSSLTLPDPNAGLTRSLITCFCSQDYQAALLEDNGDGRSIHTVGSRRTQSTAGFSLATKAPAGAYQGGPGELNVSFREILF